MSALKALSIDNVIIELNAPELPAMDGSASEFSSKILKTGKKYLDKNRKYLSNQTCFCKNWTKMDNNFSLR